MKKTVFLLGSLLFIFSSLREQNCMTDKRVRRELDIDGYLGIWYEIARYDHSVERGLEGVTATYSMRKDGKIKVVNAGFKGGLDGKRSKAVGKAKVPDPNVPSKLKVSFFLWFYGDYYVMELDKEYQWAVIGSRSDNFLWILSRTPKMDSGIYNELISRLQKRGYDTSKLIKVLQ